MKTTKAIDNTFEGVLIYEGAILAHRRLVPQAQRFIDPPTISEVVWWMRPRRFGWTLPVFVVGYLAAHFWKGGY